MGNLVLTSLEAYGVKIPIKDGSIWASALFCPDLNTCARVSRMNMPICSSMMTNPCVAFYPAAFLGRGVGEKPFSAHGV